MVPSYDQFACKSYKIEKEHKKHKKITGQRTESYIYSLYVEKLQSNYYFQNL